jgi:hypothetical protein
MRMLIATLGNLAGELNGLGLVIFRPAVMGVDRNVKKQQSAANCKLPAQQTKGFNHSKIDQVNENRHSTDLTADKSIDYLALEL